MVKLACKLFTGSCLVAALAAFHTHASAVAPSQPELDTQWVSKPGWSNRTYAIAAANPYAARAGQAILRAGGSAVDAAVATQMVLTLVEPQSSGIGGGAFLLHFDGSKTQAFDGRETAPTSASSSLFLQSDGTPMPFREAAVGGLAVGVPGVVSMLFRAHQEHGRLPWKKLFDPAIALAQEGFLISSRMAALLESDAFLKKDPVARAYFYDSNGRPWRSGHRLRNPELASVLKKIAHHGPTALMEGEVAESIVRKVQKHPINPGKLELSDLKNYAPVVREPLCFEYRVDIAAKAYQICGMPPPSSGQIAIGQILGMLDNTGAANLPLLGSLPSSSWLHIYSEASRLAFADRAQYVADPEFTLAPAGNWSNLLNPDYLRTRASLIDTSPNGQSMADAPPGTPGPQQVAYAPMKNQYESGTSHLSIVDGYGNALAMTTSIEDGWGSRQMVNRGHGLKGGFLLNNQLTDFSFLPTGKNDLPVANRLEGGKRPRSAMSPTLVFDQSNGKLVMTAGSPGGALIIHFMAKTLIGALNWNLDVQRAIDLPNFGSIDGTTFLEAGKFAPPTLAELRARNHKVIEVALPSGLQGIQRNPAGLYGGADPRREGIVLGD